jgi:glutaredoxin
MPDSTLIFYTTAGCHLCEQAEELLRVLIEQKAIAVETVDIATEEALVERYGIRIPVVLNVASQQDIGWPFGYEDLLSLI